IVLERPMAERGRYPAMNILKSISRTMPGCNTDEQNALIFRARKLISSYEDMAELIRLGAYRKGSNPEVDEAIYYYPRIREFLRQGKDDHTALDTCYKKLAEVLTPQAPPGDAPGAAPAAAAQRPAGNGPRPTGRVVRPPVR